MNLDNRIDFVMNYAKFIIQFHLRKIQKLALASMIFFSGGIIAESSSKEQNEQLSSEAAKVSPHEVHDDLKKDLTWGAEKKQLEKRYELSRVQYSTFNDKMNKAFGNKIASHIVIYIISDPHNTKQKRMLEYCNTEFYTLLVFYNDKLLYYIMQTEKMEKDVHYKGPDCFRDTFFGEGKMPDEWFHIARDIWHHRAIGRQSEDEISYYYQMISYGENTSPADFYQYSYFHFDKKAVDELIQKSKFIRDLKQKPHPTRVFTSYFFN